MDQEQQPFDVFISHSSKDSLTASAIKQSLQNKGIRCWKAPDEILPGESWPSAIMRALSRCRVMVLVWTGNSMTSTEVSKELTLAMRNNLTVVPFRIDDIAPVGDWEYHLANTHWLDASHGLAEKHYEYLGDFLLKILPARVDNTAPQEPRITLQDLEQLIEQALEDGVLTDQERKLLLVDAVALGRNAEEFTSELDSRLAKRIQELAGKVADVNPGVASTTPPLPLPVPAAAVAVHPVSQEYVPAASPILTPAVRVGSSRNVGKTVLWGFLWSCACYIVGLIIFMIVSLAVGNHASDSAYVLVGLLMIAIALSPIIVIILTVLGKLPGTRKS